MSQSYLIASPTPAVVFEEGRRNVILVPEDSIVDVPLALDGVQGLIEVTVNGNRALMFAEDIKERGEPAPPDIRQKTVTN